MKLVLNVNKLVSGTSDAYSQGVAYVAIYDERDGSRQLLGSEKIVGMIHSSTYRRVVENLRAPEGRYVIEVDPIRETQADITIAMMLGDDEEVPNLEDKLEAGIISEDVS